MSCYENPWDGELEDDYFDEDDFNCGDPFCPVCGQPDLAPDPLDEAESIDDLTEAELEAAEAELMGIYQGA